MDTDNSNFKWPDSPPYPHSDWWQLSGAELGLEPDQVRFAAALVTLGGPDSRNNSMAARLVGMDLNRTEAFRLARSVKVRRLINNAEEIKAGKRQPLTEAQIDERIDKMIASPDHNAADKGIRLREARKAARIQAESREESLEEAIAGTVAAIPESAVGAFLAMSSFNSRAGSIVNFTFIRECAPVIAKTYPAEWSAWRAKAPSHWHRFLDQMAAGPLLEGDELTIAVRARLPARVRIRPTAEATDAAS